MLGHAWLVTALNPKSITFFVAFLPAFLDPHADFWTQMLVFDQPSSCWPSPMPSATR
jgi:threonine/homoserine/homoserine lactone efflux protein